MAFYAMDPWGSQRGDQQAALIAIAAMQSAKAPPLGDLLLYPDERNDLPDDVASEEQSWMLKLKRTEGN